MGARDATRRAFTLGLVEDGEIWMDMIRTRNLTFHTYNQDLAKEMALRIIEAYRPAFRDLLARLSEFEASA